MGRVETVSVPTTRFLTVVIGTLGVLAACGPLPDEGWAAVQISPEGELALLVHLCPDEVLDTYSIVRHGNDGIIADASWAAFDPREGPGYAPSKVMFFEALAGWEVEEEGNLLPMEDDAIYRVTSTTYGNQVGLSSGRKGSVDFTPKQLKSMDLDEVLVFAEATDGEVITLDDFAQRGQHECG